MNKISYALIILCTFIFPLNAFATSCEDIVNLPKPGVTFRKKGNQKRLWSTYRTNYQSQEQYWKAYDKANTKARIALMNKYKNWHFFFYRLKNGEPEQYVRGIQVLATCTSPRNYVQVTVGRRFD